MGIVLPETPSRMEKNLLCRGGKSAPYVVGGFCLSGRERKKNSLLLQRAKVPSFGDVLSRRNQVEASAPTVLLREGGPLVFEGWSDDSGTLFVYKKETKPSSSEHVSRSACHSGEKCVLTRHSDKPAEPPPTPPKQDGYSVPGLTGN